MPQTELASKTFEPSQMRLSHSAKKSGSDIVALVFLVLSLCSALSLVLPGVQCNECALAEAIQRLPGLKWCGIFAYSFLLIGCLRFGWNQCTCAILLSLLGAHVILAGYLICSQVLCWPCNICAASIAIAAGAVIFSKRVATRDAIVIAATSALVFGGTEALAWKIEKIKLEADVKQSVDFSHLTRLPDSRLTLYAFTVDNCKNCLDFKQIDLGAVRSKFGDNVSICLNQAPPKLRRVPVIVLAGREKMLIIGRFRKTEKLLQRISENLISRPKN